MSEPPLVGHRNHFTSAHEIVDIWLHRLYRCGIADLHDVEKIKDWMQQFARDILLQSAFAVETGSKKGINQAIALMLEPEYYERKKATGKRSRQRYEEKQEAERKQREMKRILGPTQMEINRKRIGLENNIRMYRELADHYEKELRALPAAKTVRLAESEMVQ